MPTKEFISNGVFVTRVTDPVEATDKQAEFYRACEEPGAEEIMFDGSIRAGKSQACLRKIVAWAWQYGGRYAVARKTLPELENSTMKMMIDGEGALPPALPVDLVERFVKTVPTTAYLKNGAEILFTNMESVEQGKAKLRNISLNAMFIDQVEELDGDEWEEFYVELMGRLSDPRGPGKMLLAANPGPTDHWAYKRFIDPETQRNYPQCRYVHTTLYDNRENLDKRYFESRLRTEHQNPEYFKRMVMGEWGAFGSKRFKQWNRLKHVIDPFTVPVWWECIEVIDYGYSHPFVCLWIVIDDMERYYVIAEHHVTERPASWHAAEIKRIRDSLGLKPSVTWADPSIFAPKGGMSSPAMELMDYGVYPSPADNDRIGGWNRIEEMLLREVEGQPQLRVFSHCRHLIKEIPNLRFKENSDDVEKKNDHASDALRYGLMSRPPVPTEPDMDDEAAEQDFNDRRAVYFRDKARKQAEGEAFDLLEV